MNSMNVIGHEGLYKVSEGGQIWSIKNNKWLMPWDTGRGYLQVMLGKKRLRVHRVVANAWIPNPENKPEVNHKNRDRKDNRVENLEWCTRKENQEHFLKSINGGILPIKKSKPRKHPIGVGAKGKYNGNAKLQETDIFKIREMKGSTSHIAVLFGLTQSYVSKIKRKRVWAHI